MAFLPNNTPLLFQNYLAKGAKSTIFDDAPELNRLLKLKYAAEIQKKKEKKGTATAADILEAPRLSAECHYYAYPGRKLINPKLKLIMVAECYQPNAFSQTAVRNFIC